MVASTPMLGVCAPTAKILYDGSVYRGLPVLVVLLLCACSEGPGGSAATGEEALVPPLSTPDALASEPAAAAAKPATAAPTPAKEAAPLVPRADLAPDVMGEKEPLAVQEPAPTSEPSEPAEKPSAPVTTASRQEATLGVHLTEGTQDMKLVSLAVGIAVEERTPVGVADRFTEIPPRFHCHCVVDSRAPESTIIHTWRRGARVVSRVELQVGKSPAWRTWSRQRIRPEWADQWSCTASTLDGHVLGRATFEVVGDVIPPKGP